MTTKQDGRRFEMARIQLLPGRSHLDHGLSAAQLQLLLDVIDDVQSGIVTLGTITVPEELVDGLESALYGPICGDDPILDSEVEMVQRSADRPASRMINRPKRPTPLLSYVCGPIDGTENVYLYTAFGGYIAAREPGDSSLILTGEIDESKAFWAVHALAR